MRRYKQITGITEPLPSPYQVSLQNHRNVLFFNLGFLNNLQNTPTLSSWIPTSEHLKEIPNNLVIVDDKDMGVIHEMALYRQSRVRLQDDQKLVADTGFFNTEALPEGSILIFPVAIKNNMDKDLWSIALEGTEWQQNNEKFWSNELYFGGLESIGFGRCQVTLTGQYFNQE